MGERKLVNTVTGGVLLVTTVLFIAVLSGFGSGSLTDDPPAVSPYASSADTTKPPRPEEVGDAVYQSRCAGCHQADLSGGVGPALGAGSRVPSLSDDDIRSVISNGRGGMPAFGGRLAPEDIDGIIAFLRQTG